MGRRSLRITFVIFSKLGKLSAVLAAIVVLSILTSCGKLSTSVETFPPPVAEGEVLQDQDYVSINTFAVMGPIGSAYVPAEYKQLPGATEVQAMVNREFYFPSVLVFSSLTPVFQARERNGKITQVQSADLAPQWLNLGFEITPICDKGSEDACLCWILQLNPTNSESRSRDQLPVKIASTAQDLGASMIPFFPSSTFNEKFTASASGLTVLFRKMFPPHSQAVQYAYLDRQSGDSSEGAKGGWFFREVPTQDANSNSRSILGLQGTSILLQANTAVRTFKITLRTLAQWNAKTGQGDTKYTYRKPNEIRLDSRGNMPIKEFQEVLRAVAEPPRKETLTSKQVTDNKPPGTF